MIGHRPSQVNGGGVFRTVLVNETAGVIFAITFAEVVGLVAGGWLWRAPALAVPALARARLSYCGALSCSRLLALLPIVPQGASLSVTYLVRRGLRRRPGLNMPQ